MTTTRRVLSVVGIVLLLVNTVPAAPTITSIMPLTTANGHTFCTTFSINRAEHLWATAGHCVAFAIENNIDMHIGGSWVIVVYAVLNPTADWAVLQSGASGPALILASSAPKTGDAIEIRGFPYGTGDVVQTKGYVGAHQAPPIEGEAYPISDVLDVTVAPGNSGSPVLRKGRVVGLLWGRFRTSEHGLAIPWEALRQHLSDFWETT